MYRKITYSSLLFLFTLLSFTRCENENSGFREYYNPMGNNPVQVVNWLIDLKESLYKHNARISLYEYETIEYYVVEVFKVEGSESITSYTVYEKNDKEAIRFVHSDNINASEQNEMFLDFVDHAESLALLWSNREAS